MKSVQIFNYDGAPVAFQEGPNGMINVTPVVQRLGKRLDNYMRLKQSREFINILTEEYGSRDAVIQIVQGGDAQLQGTYMCKVLSLNLAAWLNPRFNVWVFTKITELLSKGSVSLNPIESKMISTLQALTDTTLHNEKILSTIESRQEELMSQFTEIMIDVRKSGGSVDAKIDELIAKTTTVSDDYYAIAGYCKLHSVPCPLSRAMDWGKRSVALSAVYELPTGEASDPRWGSVRTYHKNVLSEIILGKKIGKPT
jgi:nitrite reductase/ring-hydroxylating ferredoxin subunit